MSDEVVFTDGGRTYRVMGLEAKAASISSAVFETDQLIGDLISAANDALAEWRGRHAVTFAEDVNDVLAKMSSLRIALWDARNVVSAFPEAPAGGSSYMHDLALRYARVAVPGEEGTASASPSMLRAYSGVASGQYEQLPTLASTVNLDGVWAEVSYERCLTTIERQNRIDSGVDPTVVAQETATMTEPVIDVATLIPLVSPEPEVAALQAACQSTGELATAVAIAFENADTRLLDLLAIYPDLAGFVVEGMDEGRVGGESSLAILLAYFATFDTAADGGDRDGEVSEDDLRAITERADLPDYVQDAAQYLLDNPVMFGLAETVNESGYVLGEHGDGRISEGDVSMFLELNANLRVVEQHFDSFDVAAHGGEGDGRVSNNDLEAVAAGTGAMANAAQWLLDHDTQRGRLDAYEDAKEHGQFNVGTDGTFSRNSLIGLAVDQQIYGDDPQAAHEFVSRLPIPGRDESGIPIWLCSDEGTKALANTALIDTAADLTDTHDVIAHLPETEGAVRNQLVTAYYSELAQRADALFAGDVAGRPWASGHPGANWLQYAPWASNGVHDAITGDISVFGIHPGMTDRQAGADGNQVLFHDIGGRYAAFVEMYEANPHPSAAQLEAFFSDNFHDGDAQIRDGFAAYVGVMEETDPVHRQELMFQGNTLVAMHEQAKVQPHVEELSTGPDDLVVEYIDLTIGTADPIDLNHDLPALHLRNNHVDDAHLLDLDPAGRGPADYQASVSGATQFSVGTADSAPGVVHLAPIDGIASWEPDFPTSTTAWSQEGGEVPHVTPAGPSVVITDVPGSPDGMEGSGANSWPDRSERMWTILKLFEQNHTNPQLYQTDRRQLDLDDIGWLDPATGLR